MDRNLSRALLSVAACMVLASAGVEARPAGGQSLPADVVTGDHFRYAGRDWQLVEGLRAVAAPADGEGRLAGSDDAVLGRTGPWQIVRAGGNGLAGEALAVAWNARNRQYGVVTGEVVAYSAPGSAVPAADLPAGLLPGRCFPAMGLCFYRLEGVSLEPVRALAGQPGVQRAELVVKTGTRSRH